MYRYRLLLRKHRRAVRALGIIALIAIVAVAGGLWLTAHRKPAITDFNSCIKAGFDASNSYPQTCTDGHETWSAKVAPAPVQTATAPAGVQQDYTILVTGDSRGTYPKTERVITTQADWQAFWAAVHSGLNPMPNLLPVDFATQEVVVIVQGLKPTSGYSLQLTGILATGDSATVTYGETEPGPTCKLTETPNDNYLLVATPKLAGPVTFSPTVNKRPC